MEPRVQTYADPADVLGSELNEWQDATVEERFADGCTNNVPAGWAAPATIATQRVGCTRIMLHHECLDPGAGQETILDASVDWRDVYIDRGWVAGEDNQIKMPGGTNYAAAATYAKQEIDGYTGKGATGGAPPTLQGVGTAGVGEYWTPWGNFYIYAKKDTGELACYNNIHSTVYLWGVIGLSGDIGGF